MRFEISSGHPGGGAKQATGPLTQGQLSSHRLPGHLGVRTSPPLPGKQRGSGMRVEWKCLRTELHLPPPGQMHWEEGDQILKALCSAL